MRGFSQKVPGTEVLSKSCYELLLGDQLAFLQSRIWRCRAPEFLLSIYLRETCWLLHT